MNKNLTEILTLPFRVLHKKQQFSRVINKTKYEQKFYRIPLRLLRTAPIRVASVGRRRRRHRRTS